MNILVTASVGLYYNPDTDSYYLQLIFPDTQYNTLISITKQKANNIALSEDVEIAENPEIYL